MTTLALIFKTLPFAVAVTKAIGSKTLSQPGKHYYRNILQLTGKDMLPEKVCLYGCPAHPMETSYAAVVLPQTGCAGPHYHSRRGGSRFRVGDCFWINILTDERAAADKPEEFWRLTKGCFL